MTPTQKYLIAGGIGGVAVYLLWKMWTSKNTSAVRVEDEVTPGYDFVDEKEYTTGCYASYAGNSSAGPLTEGPGDVKLTSGSTGVVQTTSVVSKTPTSGARFY